MRYKILYYDFQNDSLIFAFLYEWCCKKLNKFKMNNDASWMKEDEQAEEDEEEKEGVAKEEERRDDYQALLGQMHC